MLEIKNDKKHVKIDGEVYELSKPKNKDAAALFNMSNSEGSDSFESGILFLVSCGLPKKVAMDLDIENTASIVEYLLPEKKS